MVDNEQKASKILHNGQIFIIRLHLRRRIILLTAYDSLTGRKRNDNSPLAINIEWLVRYLNNCSI